MRKSEVIEEISPKGHSLKNRMRDTVNTWFMKRISHRQNSMPTLTGYINDRKIILFKHSRNPEFFVKRISRNTAEQDRFPISQKKYTF